MQVKSQKTNKCINKCLQFLNSYPYNIFRRIFVLSQTFTFFLLILDSFPKEEIRMHRAQQKIKKKNQQKKSYISLKFSQLFFFHTSCMFHIYSYTTYMCLQCIWNSQTTVPKPKLIHYNLVFSAIYLKDTCLLMCVH